MTKYLETVTRNNTKRIQELPFASQSIPIVHFEVPLLLLPEKSVVLYWFVLDLFKKLSEDKSLSTDIKHLTSRFHKRSVGRVRSLQIFFLFLNA